MIKKKNAAGRGPRGAQNEVRTRGASHHTERNKSLQYFLNKHIFDHSYRVALKYTAQGGVCILSFSGTNVF